MSYLNVLDKIGMTPLTKLDCSELNNINLYAKLEYYNPTGSVKDRAANYIIKRLLDQREINEDTTLIESSSGNFGIALSAYANKYGLKFICVIDSHTLPVNEMLIKSLSYRVEKVTELDSKGGYLLNRIKRVKELKASIPNSYWINQYANPYNADAYFNTLGNEICTDMDNIDYIFLGVSSGGTITGVSRKIKEKFPKAKVIAVDIVGSVIFGGAPSRRFIPGIGSGMVPEILSNAIIDDVVMMDEIETIEMCNNLLKKHSIFAGGSSGSVYGAINKYFKGKTFHKKPNVVAVFADRGDRYSTTIYNNEWCSDFVNKHKEYKEILLAK